MNTFFFFNFLDVLEAIITVFLYRFFQNSGGLSGSTMTHMHSGELADECRVQFGNSKKTFSVGVQGNYPGGLRTFTSAFLFAQVVLMLLMSVFLKYICCFERQGAPLCSIRCKFFNNLKTSSHWLWQEDDYFLLIGRSPNMRHLHSSCKIRL